MVRIALQPFTLQRCQPPDEQRPFCSLVYQISGVFMLACALGRGNAIILKTVYPLSGKYGRRYQWQIISAGPIGGDHSWRYFKRPLVPCVLPMIVEQDQRLVSMFLGPECPCYIFRSFDYAAALIVQAEDRGHHVAAGGGFQCGRYFLLIPDTPCG